MDSRLYASGPMVGALPIAPYSLPLGHPYAHLRPGVPQSYSIEGILGVQPPFVASVPETPAVHHVVRVSQKVTVSSVSKPASPPKKSKYFDFFFLLKQKSLYSRNSYLFII